MTQRRRARALMLLIGAAGIVAITLVAVMRPPAACSSYPAPVGFVKQTDPKTGKCVLVAWDFGIPGGMLIILAKRPHVGGHQ